MVCIGGNYDAVGHQTAFPLTLNGRSDRTISTEYDHLGNATSIRQHGNAVDEIFAEFDCNANGLLTSVRRYAKDDDTINEIAESLYTYNANNAVTSITHNDSNGSQIVKHSYTYDSTNNIVEYLNFIDGQTSYDYDYLGQLISADHANQTDESYVYDSNGNRVTANGDTYTTGDNNELTSDGTYTYTYDAEGNRVSKTNSTNRELYEWDHRNRLTKVTQQEWDSVEETWATTQIVEYSYDYNNVWIRKTVGENKTIFIPENYQTAVQIDNGTVSHHYLWTPNAQDKLIADTTPTEVLWSLTDHLGTIRDILAATTTHLIYDAFGNLTSGTNPLLFGYTGKPFDPATNLQNNVNRWYDATIGRWLSVDPIGFEGNDTNLYRYIANKTNIQTDRLGFAPEYDYETVEIQNFVNSYVDSSWEIVSLTLKQPEKKNGFSFHQRCSKIKYTIDNTRKSNVRVTTGSWYNDRLNRNIIDTLKDTYKKMKITAGLSYTLEQVCECCENINEISGILRDQEYTMELKITRRTNPAFKGHEINGIVYTIKIQYKIDVSYSGEEGICK